MALQVRLRKGGCAQIQAHKGQKTSGKIMRLHERKTYSRVPENTRYESSPCVGSMAQYEAEMPRSQLADRISIRETGRKEHVYDIRNCGPRHRFTVYDPSTGKLRIVSNCTQSIARDILCEAMRRMEGVGLRIVAHVHDEVIIEAPRGKYSVEDVCKMMNERPAWGRDIPLASAGYIGAGYYFKD